MCFEQAIIASRSWFLDSLMRMTCEQCSVSSACFQLLAAILADLRQGLEVTAGYPAGSLQSYGEYTRNTKAAPPSTALDYDAFVLLPWRTAWLPSMAHIIVSPDYDTRTNCVYYLVPNLLKLDPFCLGARARCVVVWSAVEV